LRTLTFQLAGADSETDGLGAASGVIKTERAIFVRYLALVSPTIHMSGTQ